MAPTWPIDRADPQSLGLCPQRLTRICDLIRHYVDESRIAGAVTLVARRGRIAHLESFGLMDLDPPRPMPLDAIFRIYSMTKIVTSVAVLMLMEEGRFLLTQPVSRFIPEFKDLRVAVTGADGREELVRPRREVTIHDLLAHLGGLTYDLIHEARESGLSLQEFVTRFCRRPLRSHPGDSWNYSASTDVLGRLVEVLAEQPFDAFLRQRIFQPLGMTDTAFCVPPEKASRLAWVYTHDDDARLVSAEDRDKSPFLKPVALPSGGGGLVSTASDYLRFSLMLLNKGSLNDVRLLGPKTVDLMTADHLPPGHPPLDVNNRGFGLGVSVLRRLGEAKMLGSPGEFGWGGAACTQAWIDPAENMISLIMLQYRPKEKFPLMDLFKQSVYQAVIA